MALESAEWQGQSAMTYLHVVQSVRPDIVIVQLGTHDLSFRAPLLMGSDPEDFVHLLHAPETERHTKHAAGGGSPREQNPLAKEREIINHACQVARKTDRQTDMFI